MANTHTTEKVAQFLSEKFGDEMSQTLSILVIEAFQLLLRVGNTTTLDVKNTLIKGLPSIYWKQDYISQIIDMWVISNGVEKGISYTLSVNDEGDSFRVYSSADMQSPTVKQLLNILEKLESLEVSNRDDYNFLLNITEILTGADFNSLKEDTSTGESAQDLNQTSSQPMPTETSENAVRLSRTRIVEKMKNSSGRMMSVTFIKNNGDTRTMNGNVSKDPFTDNQGYILFNERGQGVKRVNPRTITKASIDGVTYTV